MLLDSEFSLVPVRHKHTQYCTLSCNFFSTPQRALPLAMKGWLSVEPLLA
jgi:hypothetical protein